MPSLCDSKAQSPKTQSEGSQTNPSSPRRLRSNSTALGTSTQDARASLSRPNRFQRTQTLKQKRRESRYRHPKFVRRPRYNFLTKMEASTSQDIIDLTIPTKGPKTSPDSNSPTVSEQLHLLTSQVNQLKINSEQTLEQTKPLIQTFPLAKIKQFQYLHAVQHQVAQLFVDLNTEKSERLRLWTTIRHLEEELTLLVRQINEPSTSIPLPFTVDPPSSAAFQDSGTLGSIQILKPGVTITLRRPSSTMSRSQPTESTPASPSNQTTAGSSLDLETRV